MKRRTFLQVAAAIPAAVFLPKRDSDQPAEYKPPPRWEWEVGEWKDGRREWQACVDAMPFELSSVCNGEIGANDRPFCGARSGHLVIRTMTADRLAHGLIVWTVSLLERKTPWHPVTLFADDGKAITIQLRKTANFYDLFRGEHAVVSAGKLKTRSPKCN